MSHYVVTGGAGFIGSAIVRRLLEEGARRVVVVDNLSTGSERNLEEVRRSVEFERADVDVLNVRGRVVVVGTPDDQHVHHVGEEQSH